MCRSRCTAGFAESIIAILTAAFAAPSLAQNGLPAQIEAPPESRYFGSRVASGGDADGDGFDDIFVMDDGAEESGIVLGRWHMYSGRDRTLMWSGVGAEPAVTDLHFTADFIGDIDGDGGDDVVVGRPAILDQRGGVDVFSGRTGELLFSARGDNPADLMGRCAAGVGDVDGDSVPDFAYAARYTAQGAVSVRSGRDGGEIHRLELPWPRRIRGAGDINADARADLAIGLRHWTQRDLGLRVVSGRDASVIHNISRPDPQDSDFAYQVAAGVDATGDRVPDLLVSGDLFRHRAYLFSGATGEVVTTFEYGDPLRGIQLYGVNLALADLTGDGIVEAVIGTARVILVYDPLSPQIINRRYVAYFRGSMSGNEVATGDVNGDAIIDFVLGRTEMLPGGGAVAMESGGRLLLFLDSTWSEPRNVMQAGQTSRFVVFGGQVGRTIHLFATRAGIGCTFVPRLGICIDLATPILRVGDAVTEPDGFARFAVAVPLRAPESTAWIQTLDVNDPQRGPITSNVMEVEIVRP